jgi:hypothetical protein
MLRGAFSGLLTGENQGAVSVPHEAEPGPEMGKIFLCAPGREKVLPDGLSGAAVRQGEIALLDDQGQMAQVITLLGRQLPGCPYTGCGGIGVEDGDVHLTNGCPVVVAHDTDMVRLAKPGDAIMRVRSVADDVSEAPYLIYSTTALDVIQHCAEGCQIGMDIGKNSVMHVV